MSKDLAARLWNQLIVEERRNTLWGGGTRDCEFSGMFFSLHKLLNLLIDASSNLNAQFKLDEVIAGSTDKRQHERAGRDSVLWTTTSLC